MSEDIRKKGEGWVISFNEEEYGGKRYNTIEELKADAKNRVSEEYHLDDIDSLDDIDKELLENGEYGHRVYCGFIKLLTPQKLAKYLDVSRHYSFDDLEENLAEESITYEDSLIDSSIDLSDIDLPLANLMFDKQPELWSHTYLDQDSCQDYYVDITKEDIENYKNNNKIVNN